MVRVEKTRYKDLWMQAACASLSGLTSDGNTPIKDEAGEAARAADRLMEEYVKRFPEDRPKQIKIRKHKKGCPYVAYFRAYYALRRMLVDADA